MLLLVSTASSLTVCGVLIVSFRSTRPGQSASYIQAEPNQDKVYRYSFFGNHNVAVAKPMPSDSFTDRSLPVLLTIIDTAAA
jgi:hypothetical protein